MSRKSIVMKLCAISMIAGLCNGVSLCLAADEAAQTQPSSLPLAQPQDWSGRVTFVKGDVRVRDSNTSFWKRAQVGMMIPAAGEIQTGFKSQVDVCILPAQTVTLDRMTTVKLAELGRYRDKQLAMKYGRTQLNIEKSGIVHDAKISTPSATQVLRSAGSVDDRNGFPKPVVRSYVVQPELFSTAHPAVYVIHGRYGRPVYSELAFRNTIKRIQLLGTRPARSEIQTSRFWIGP